MGLTDTGQMGLMGHTTADGKRKALSTIIPMINGTHFHALFAVTCKILNEERIRNVNAYKVHAATHIQETCCHYFCLAQLVSCV